MKVSFQYDMSWLGKGVIILLQYDIVLITVRIIFALYFTLNTPQNFKLLHLSKNNFTRYIGEFGVGMSWKRNDNFVAI